ncbi:MAG: anhydro-N-acetylmuramic acid kinase, partial [bacterium]
MSGTSVDAIDAVLVAFEENQFNILGETSSPIPPSIQEQINRLCTPGSDNLDLLGEADVAIGDLFATTALNLLEKTQTPAERVAAIGSHGQTVRHRPPTQDAPGFTQQIGDPNRIAATTGIRTVADFRRKDMALGGQGAPLVPGFHQALFGSKDENRAIINIGGIANITWLPKSGNVLGFDTGPGNTLLDNWCKSHWDKPFDDGGEIAACGNVAQTLLERLLQDPYLSQPIPKSTGRELFNHDWLSTHLSGFAELDPIDIQRTLTEFTAQTIVDGLQFLPESPDEIFLCGGGALNTFLVSRIADLANPILVDTTSSLGLDPRHVEAAAFAWLARQTINGINGSLASVTGATRDA